VEKCLSKTKYREQSWIDWIDGGDCSFGFLEIYSAGRLNDPKVSRWDSPNYFSTRIIRREGRERRNGKAKLRASSGLYGILLLR